MNLTRFLRLYKNCNWMIPISNPPYNIKVTYKEPYYHLYCAEPSTPLQREANGIVLDENLDIVCYGYNAEALLKELDEKAARSYVTQFVDGYWFWIWSDGKHWHYTTPTNLDAYEQPITNHFSFGEYVDKITEGLLTRYLTPNHTYMFQLIEDKVWYYGTRSMETLDFEYNVPHFVKDCCAPIHIFSNGMWDEKLFSRIEKASDTELGCTFWNDELWANKPYGYYKKKRFNVKKAVKKYFDKEKLIGFEELIGKEIDIYFEYLQNIYDEIKCDSKIHFIIMILQLEPFLKNLFKEIYNLDISFFDYYKERQEQLIREADLKFYLY